MTVPRAAETVRGWQNGIRSLWTAQGGGAFVPLTMEQLLAIMPQLRDRPDLAARYLPLLNAAMAEGGITTPRQKAAFLAQLGEESGGLTHLLEEASGVGYQGGSRYKGRGPIQLTGLSNYRAAGAALGLDLVNHPELAADPAIGFRVAQWYWNLPPRYGTLTNNQLADSGTLDNFRTITRTINGGLNGEPVREQYWYRARQVLGG